MNPYSTTDVEDAELVTERSWAKLVVQLLVFWLGTFVGVVVATSIIDVGELIDKTRRDPMGGLLTVSVVAVVLLLASMAYRSLCGTKRFVSRIPKIPFAAGFLSSAFIILMLFGSSKLFAAILGDELLNRLPTWTPIAIIAGTCIVGTALGSESERWRAIRIPREQR